MNAISDPELDFRLKFWGARIGETNDKSHCEKKW